MLSGQDYLELVEYDREVYVTGVERMKWLVPCVYGRKAQQLAAMFAKWLEASPERWHEPAAKSCFPSPCSIAAARLNPGQNRKLNPRPNPNVPPKARKPRNEAL